MQLQRNLASIYRKLPVQDRVLEYYPSLQEGLYILFVTWKTISANMQIQIHDKSQNLSSNP